ncbi:MAG TPA: L-threonylcarbamoyladenylate synthase [Cellulomonadaceae bacterium]|nr:L-threonylcarbamoyladenylate synthase [Cellulomonadaceae bacterium]
MTESSDETTPLDGSPATAPDGSTHEPGSAVTSGEPLPDVEPEPVPEIEPEAVPEIEPEPEPEREPIVLSAEDLPTAIETVRTAIRAGESVVFPTDTVYGIAADPFSPQAVQGLLDAKNRGRDMPPPVLIGDAEVLEAYTSDVPAAARLLANRYWPGPLTLILTAQESLRMDLGETKGSIGVRVPDHEVARAILRATGPLAVSSANISGEPAATDAYEARRQLRGSVAVYVDGGATPGPTPSTIVDFATDLTGRVVRVGAIGLDELRKLLPGLEGPEPDPIAEEPAPADEPKAEAGAPIANDAVAATDVPETSEVTPVAEIEGTTP